MFFLSVERYVFFTRRAFSVPSERGRLYVCVLKSLKNKLKQKLYETLLTNERKNNLKRKSCCFDVYRYEILAEKRNGRKPN